MSYMRGDYYLWQDGSRIHFWVHDGYDFWDESVWVKYVNDELADDSRPSGVALPLEVVDEFVVMRLAQLIDSRTLAKTVRRAVKKWEGNIGCDALKNMAGSSEKGLRQEFEKILSEVPDSEPDERDEL